MHEKELEVLDVKGVVAENDKLNKRIKKALPVVFHDNRNGGSYHYGKNAAKRAKKLLKK